VRGWLGGVIGGRLHAHHRRRENEHALVGHALPLVRPQLARDMRIGVERAAGIAQLLGVQLLQARRIGAAHPGGELGRLLVALDQRALDVLLLGNRGEGRA
jgi:hypothetical protein